MAAWTIAMRGYPKEFEWCSLREAGLDHWKDKFVRRKRGRVVYCVVGAFKDESYKQHYNFTNYFVRLERRTEGSKSQPPWSMTSVPAEDFRYNFVDILKEGATP